MADKRDQLFKDFIELEVFADLNQEVIVTTEDKLKLTLTTYYNKVGRKRDWVAPFGIMLTTLTIFLTSTFKDFIVSSNTWQAIFILVFIGSLVWFIFSLKHAFKENKIEDIIIELKKNKKTT
jgi:hypothetical protein